MVVALDAATGKTRWTQPGSPSYGDLWAVGDGAVYVIDADESGVQESIVAYELPTGQVRWRRASSSELDASQPQHAAGKSVVLLWQSQLAVLSSDKGTTRWASQAPLASPMMSSASTNSDTLFVSTNSLPWGD
jgi:outer membrane protein assembly factor BamB